ILTLCFLLAGCATNSSDKSDKLIIGVDDTFAPMGFRDENNELVGFDIDLATLIAEKIDIEIEFLPIDWAMKETELNSKNIDMIWNGYTIADKRKEQVNFTTPYLENRQIIIVSAKSDIASKADLAGKTLSVQKESSALEAVMKEESFAASLNEGKPIEFDTNIDCFMDLEAGRSDAIVCDEVLARYVMKQRGAEKYRVLEDNFGEEEYGIGVRKSDTELLNQLNNALEECMKDGSYDELYKKWFAE
ncbi:MAG: amino acid ABC transporter substrate-binding protein, partial [Erysipelotrichaceae bacterium]|nr:amino acid ABC transporter substrate-binding protein [Erysipelotrichaceae bacterium]